MNSKKALEKEIKSRRGKILFRGDMKLSEIIGQCPEMVVLSRRLIGLLFPWNMKMLNIVVPNRQLSFNEKLSMIRGMEISKDQLFSLYMASWAYERLATMSYNEKYKKR